MPPEVPERHVGGLWCREVLARLPDLLDGTLPPAERASVHAHVAGCDWCERFGGRYGALVSGLRSPAPEMPADAARRLDDALERLIAGSS